MTWPTPSSGPNGADLPGCFEPEKVQSQEPHRDDRDAHELQDRGDTSIDGMTSDRRHPSGLVITDVQVRPVSNNERLRAWVTITFNDAFVIKGIRIIQGHTRLFVAMPSRQQKDGSFQDVAHPINPEFRTYLEGTIIGVFTKGAPQAASG